jgi:hypothetical protein
MRTLVLAALMVALLAGCENATSSHSFGGNETTYKCRSSSSGRCNYVFFTTTCKIAPGERGKPANTCVHQVIEQFSLAAGESKTIATPSEQTLQCVAMATVPEYPSCAASPLGTQPGAKSN